jgi:predicted TIM-barrel fold metal-dependent hydrolase
MADIYDVHTHVGLDLGFMLRGWWPYSASAQDLLERMDANGIRFAVCFPFNLPSAFDPYAFADEKRVELLSNRVPFDRENALLTDEIVRVDRDRRLIQFGMFDPSRKVPEQIKNLQKLIGKIAGLKTQSTVLQSPIRSLLGKSKDLMEFAQQYRLPVLFHTAISVNDTWAQVADCLAVAEAFPKVRFNLAHSLRFHADHLKRAAQLPNVWVDCSAHLNHCLLAQQDSPVVPQKPERVDADYSNPTSVLETVYAMLGGKYMWGSDNPYMSWCDDRLRLMFSYREEAEVFHKLPESIRISVGHSAPRAWLYGE